MSKSKANISVIDCNPFNNCTVLMRYFYSNIAFFLLKRPIVRPA